MLQRHSSFRLFWALYFWLVPRFLGFRRQAANHGRTFRVALSDCLTSTRSTCVFQAPEHTERQSMAALGLQSKELSIHPWQTDSCFRSVRTCWYCGNIPVSPTQSQELINDTSRNSVQKRTTDSSHLSLLNSARQSRVAEFGGCAPRL